MKKIRLFKNWSRHQRSWYGKWHLYLGIIAGAVIAVVGITGSILTFREEIDAALNPKLFKVMSETPRPSLTEAYHLFHKNYPTQTVNYLYKPADNPNASYIFYDYTAQKQIFVNPFNGQICGKRLYESGFINVVMDIHTSLMIPKIGTYVVGIASLILLILTISGLRLWIPKKWKHLKEVLTVKKGASGKRQNYDWHNVLGFYSAPVVSVLALTGFCITFYLPVVAIMFSLSGKNPMIASEIYSMKSKYVKSTPALPLERIVDIGQRFLPNSEAQGIAMPADSTGSYRLDMYVPSKSKTGSREIVLVDQYSGKILAASKDFPNVAQGILSWMTPLHYGTFGGMPTRILALLGGLIPAALFVTGFVIWWPRWKKQKNADKPVNKKKLDLSQLKTNTFLMNLKAGFRYAFWMVLISAVCGIIYGLISGIILAPAAYMLIFTVPIVLVNFIIAFVTNVLHVIIFLPFKKNFKILYRYFAFSAAFLVVYGVLYFLLMNTGLKIF